MRENNTRCAGALQPASPSNRRSDLVTRGSAPLTLHLQLPAFHLACHFMLPRRQRQVASHYHLEYIVHLTNASPEPGVVRIGS